MDDRDAQKPNIFDYVDYQKFLKDFYDYLKATQRGFSHRKFAKKANIKSWNYLKAVYDRKVHISKRYRENFAEGLGLKGKEKEYFFNLIEFGKTKNLKLKNKFYSKIKNRVRKYHQEEYQDSQYKLLSKWYYVVVRNLVNQKDFKFDPKWVSKKLRGYVTTKEASEALETLDELGVIKFKDGKFVLASKHLTSSDELKSLAIRNFHSQMIPLAVKALKTNPLERREFQAITLGISKETAAKLKLKIKDFYKEVVDFVSEEHKEIKPSEVWQLNFQLFSFSKDDQ